MKTQLKEFIRSRFPALTSLWKKVYFFLLKRKSPKQIFTHIHRSNEWGDKDSVSGPGSNLLHTEVIRNLLPELVRELNCRSFLDVPCGDFFWMKLVKMDVDYIGGDIVDELIEAHQRKNGDSHHRFVHLDLLQDDVPKVDLVFCRDCLVHLSYAHIFRALRNIKKSGSTYLLTTTFVQREINEDIPTGSWRTINLQRPPFNFPAPMKLINEECPLDGFRDKHLGLWKIESIPDL